MMRRWLTGTGVALATLLIATVALAEEAEETGSGDELSEEDVERRSGVLAKIGEISITVGEFEDHLNKQGPFRRVQYSAPEKRQEFLDQMIDWELQAQHAQKQGHGDDPSVADQLKRVMSSLLLRREVDDQVRPEDVTGEEMHGYYDEHLTTFKRPERVRAYHIVISEQEKAQSLLDRLLEEGVDTREFRRLAREMSEDPVTKRRGGDLRYFTKSADRREGDPEVNEDLVKATFKLLDMRREAQSRASDAKAGAKLKRAPRRGKVPGFNPIFPKLVQTPQGYHIVRFMGHRDAVNREFEDVERQIRNRIWREKLQKSREDFIGNLREKHKVVMHEDHMDLVKITPAPRGSRPRPIKSRIRSLDEQGGPGKRPSRRRARPRREGNEGQEEGQEQGQEQESSE